MERTCLDERKDRSVISHVMRLLDSFSQEDDVLSLAEITRRSELPKATAHRLLNQLGQVGLIESREGGHCLGLRLFELGQLVAHERELRRASVPVLVELSARTGQTAHLAVLRGVDVLYLEKVPGRSSVQLPSRVGGYMPAYCTGVGKAMLAWASQQTLSDVMAAGLRRRTARTISAPGMLMQNLAKVREQGVAFEMEESAPGITCVASPIMSHGQRPIAAISIAGRIRNTELSRAAAAVQRAAANLAQAS